MKLSKEELNQIVENDLPGYSLNSNPESEERDVVDTRSRSYVEAEAHTPDLETLHRKYSHYSGSSIDSAVEESSADYDHLRNKYLGVDARDEEGIADSMEAADAIDDGNADDAIVAVSPKNSAHAWDRGSRPKAAVISGSEKRVIGQQG